MTSSPPSESEEGLGTRRGAVRLAAALTSLLGVVLVGYGVFLGAQWVVERPAEPVNAGLLVLLSLGWGAAVLWCSRGLLRRRRWAVAPVLTSALLVVAVGWLLAGGHGAEVVFGWGLLLLGAACAVAVLAAGRDLD